MKAVILARVSTEEQREAGNSLPAQIARIESYCNRKNLKIAETFSFDESAYKTKRDEFDKILDFLKEKKEKIAVCFDKVDRLSRNVFDKRVSALYEKAVADEIELHFVSDGQVINSSMSAVEKFQFGMSLGLAKYYSDAISDNVKRVFELKRRNGELTGQAKLGYVITTNENDKKDYIFDFNNCHLVKKLFELFSTGNYSITTIHNKITDLGLRGKNGTTVARSHIARTLQDTFYYGMAHSRKYGFYPHKYSPLISKELFDKCQQVSKGRSVSRSKEVSKNFILKGIAHCNKCGCLYSPEMKRGKFIYYSCTNAKGTCKRLYIPERVLLKPLYDVFEAFEGIPEKTQTRLVEKLRKLHEFEVEFHSKEINRIRAEYDNVQKRIQVLLDMRLDLSITKDDYDKKLQELKDRQYRMNLEMEEHTKADHDYHIHISTVINLSRRVKEIFESSEVNEKRALIRFLIQNPLVIEKKLVFELRKPFDTILQLAKHPTVLAYTDSFRTFLTQFRTKSLEMAVF